MKKKITKVIAAILALALTAGLSVGLTLAYLTDHEEAVNVMTLGNVSIVQHEYQRATNADGTYQTATIDNISSYVLEPFELAKPLYPSAIPTKAPDWTWDSTRVRMTQVDSYGTMDVFPESSNAQDKFVTVENTGKSDAYVRTLIAFEMGNITAERYAEILGIGHRIGMLGSTADGTFPWHTVSENVLSIDGNKYWVKECLYVGAKLSDGTWRHANGVLPAGDTTYPSLAQVYLSAEATNEDCIALDGNGNGAFDIIVLSQAVQTEGFADAQTALDTAFGDITAENHPWVDRTVTIPSYPATVAELEKALEKGGDVTLMADITLPEGETLEIAEGVTVNLDLNGKTISGNVAKSEGHVIENNGELNLVGGEIESTADNGGSAVYNAGVMTIDGTTLTGAPRAGESWPSYAINNYGQMTINNANITSTHGGVATNNGATTIVNNTIVTCNGFGGSSHLYYMYGADSQLVVNSGEFLHNGKGDGSVISCGNGTTVTVNGGTFTAKGGAYGVALGSGSTVYVNGGTFANKFLSWGGTATVTGGTFAEDVTKYLPSEYYECFKNEDGTYTAQQKSNVVFISSADELKAAFNQEVATFSRTTPDTYVLTADIDMEGYNWTPVAKFTGTFDGQGYTISNMNISGNSSVGFFGEISGATVENVTFEGVNVTGNHYVGVVFGWEGAESIQSYVTNVNVTGSTVTCTPEQVNGEWDNGDKVGGIGGYAVSTTISGCSVTDTTITAYRDAGGILGYANAKSYCAAEVTDCSAVEVTMAWSGNSENNYKGFTGESDPEIDLGILVGEAAANATVPAEVANATQLVAALEAGQEVVMTEDVNIPDEDLASSGYGATGLNQKNGGIIDGGGNVLDITGADDTWDSGINTTGGTIRNITVTGSFRGIFINHNSTHSERVILENVIIDGTVYTVSCDQGSKQGLTATNCTFNGWTSYAATLGDAKFIDCNFGEGNGYAYCRPYAPTVFEGCEFEEGFEIDTSRTSITMINCTYNGQPITDTSCPMFSDDAEGHDLTIE